jgi:hypothetical protein
LPKIGPTRLRARLFAENFMQKIGSVPGADLFQQIRSMEIHGTRADAECPRGSLLEAPGLRVLQSARSGVPV